MAVWVAIYYREYENFTRKKTVLLLCDNRPVWCKPSTSYFSYLSGRKQSVRRGICYSDPIAVICGVPQGSVPGPILFVLYTADISALVQKFGLVPHLHADDTQTYGWPSPARVDDLLERLSTCIDDVSDWMRSNRLQLNMDKTEFMWCTASRPQHHLPTTNIRVGSTQVTPSTSVCDLGIYIDSDLVMRTHVQRTVSRCFTTLRQLRSIRRSIPASTMQTLVVSLVLSRLDYESWSSDLPSTSAGVLVERVCQADLRSPSVEPYHWCSRQPSLASCAGAHQVQDCVTDFRAIRGEAPQYLSEN